MKGFLKSIYALMVCVVVVNIQAQYPSYFQITTEEGLPSNEVYSLVEDSKGIIWLGCDAGLFKYDGIRFIPYKNKNLHSKSITGLTLSKSGRIYCYTFKGQVFYVENDELVELKHALKNISNIVCDQDSTLWINHLNGLMRYDEKTSTWKDYKNYSFKKFSYTNSGFVDKQNVYWFINESGLSSIAKEKIAHYPFDFASKNLLSGNFFFASNSQKNSWFISRINGIIYKLTSNNTLEEFKNEKLIGLLKSRKITNVIPLNENELWICTYTGIVKYDIKADTAYLLYPYLAFSNCITDRQGSVWLSTLQNGIIHIPSLENQVWNAKNKGLQHDLLNKIEVQDSLIYFASLDGFIGILNKKNEQVSIVTNEVQGDIQQIYYHSDSKQLYYSINNTLYSYYDGKVNIINSSVFPLKAMLKVEDDYLLATSFGCYASSQLSNLDNSTQLDNNWTRTLNWLTKSQKLWVGSNNGITLYQKNETHWIKKAQLLDSTQIITTNVDSISETLYVITFKGEIYSINNDNELSFLVKLNESVQANQLVYDNKKLFIATNNGLWIWNLTSKKWTQVNKNKGLTSNNIQGLIVESQAIWLTTGNGIQKISKNSTQSEKRATIYLKKIIVNGEIYQDIQNIQMDYKHAIGFQLESTNYLSNGNFKYAYRIKSIDTNWIYFPGSIEQIEILKLPSGPFEIEIKSVDIFGNDSANILVLKGNVSPPYWQKWWFYILIGLGVLVLSWILFKYRISKIRAHQQLEIERIQLENELRLTQQSALKAQMNPHFLFNVLNSIKGFIYENDKKNAVNYLNNFSELVRKVLTFSSQPMVKLRDELELLELYIQLEALLLQGEFEFTKEIDNELDLEGTEIPSLIIQPYIENAFKHGLRHTSDYKKLHLKLYRDGIEKDLLIIEITDNGIGRKASSEINSNSAIPHTSFATKANEKRIELLNFKKAGIVGVHITDLTLKENQTTGTKILLKIHLQNGSNK